MTNAKKRNSRQHSQLPLVVLNSHPIQYFVPLYRYLTEAAIPLTVVYYSGQEQEKFDKEFSRNVQWDIPMLDGYRHHFLKNYGNTGYGSKSFMSRFNPGIISYLLKMPKSLVVIHSWQYATDILALLFARLAGHKIALWTETNLSHELLQPKWKQWLKRVRFRFLFGSVHHFMCIGTQNSLYYKHFGIKPTRLSFTPYCVDNDRFQSVANSVSKASARQQLGLDADAFIVLYSGKYISKKRPMDLLEAFSEVNSDRIYLVMVGEGELRAQMQQFICSKGLGKKVTLTGFINQSTIPLYYRAADLFIMCSGTGETWGLSVNEAMNFELPIIASHLTGCSSDLVQSGRNGFVFQTGDTRALADYMQLFLVMPETEIKRMGVESLSIINNYSYRQFLEGLPTGH